MRFPFGTRGGLAALAAFLLAAGACDDQVSVSGDGGPDGSTDSDTDADSDTDSDADGGPDGGVPECEIDPALVFDDVAFLASDELEGRKPGTEGNELALQAAEERFEELGLLPIGDGGTYRQAFSYQWAELLAIPSMSVDGEPLTFGDDYLPLSGTGSSAITEEIVYVGYGMTVPAYDTTDFPDCPLPSTGYDDYEGIDVAGKIALVVRHGPDDDDSVPDTCPDNDLCGAEPCLWNFTYKAANADLHGAAAMILVQHYAEGDEHMAGTLGNEGYVADLASVFVDRNILEASIPNLQAWTDGVDSTLAPDPHATGINASISVSATADDVSTANVIGAIPGTDPEIGDEVVVVGGHIDHLGFDLLGCDEGGEICYGADDNASGSAVVMELARLATGCASPARTVVFALWNGEEKGLLGSIYYVQNPVYPLASTIAAYSVDMVGTGQDTNLVLYGAVDDANAWLGQVMAGSAADMGYDWAVNPGAVSENSDHYPFAYFDIPAVCAMSGPLESHLFYHTPGDSIETIGESHLGMSASMMWAGLKPLVEGTEEQYLTSGKALMEGVAPVPFPAENRFAKTR